MSGSDLQYIVFPRQAFFVSRAGVQCTHARRYATKFLFHVQLFASLPPTSAGVVEEVLILEFFEGRRWVVHGKLFFFQQGQLSLCRFGV